MARHRNVRGYNYDEDFDDEDLYGQSVEDDYCISPATAAQFIYSKRDRHTSFTEPLEEEEFEDDVPDSSAKADIALSSVDQARLYSCLEHMREVLGDTVVEQVMIDAILQCQFDEAKALDMVFAQDNKNVKPTNQNSQSTGRTPKEDIFPSLQSLAYKQNVSCSAGKTIQCKENLQFDPCAHNELSLGVSRIFDSENENTFLDIAPKFSLSTLIDDSKPPELCEISLEDLISNSWMDSIVGGKSDLLGAKLSEVASSCSESTSEIPDMKHIQGSLMFAEDSLKVSDNKLISLSPTNENSQHQDLCNTTDLFGSLSSFLQTSDTNMSTDIDNLVASKYGSPSLADLIQEHNEINPLQDFSINSPQNNPCNRKELELGSLLCLSPHISFEIPSLTESLSSLAVCDNSSAKGTLVSLSDLISDANKPFATDSIWSCNRSPLMETDKDIDLSILISSPDAAKNAPKALPSDLIKTEHPSKLEANNKKTNSSLKCKKSIYRAKTLKARPSAFALSLCFSYIPKACKKNIFMIQQYHHINTAEESTEMGKSIIVPFNFQTPSPDDIVKANQKKAFMR